MTSKCEYLNDEGECKIDQRICQFQGSIAMVVQDSPMAKCQEKMKGILHLWGKHTKALKEAHREDMRQPWKRFQESVQKHSCSPEKPTS